MRQFAAPQGAQSEGSSGRSWLGQALHNKIIAVVLTMIIAVPLLAAPADYSLTGIAALTLETFALVLMAMLLWRSKWDLRPQQLSTFAKTSANVPLLLLLGWVALSAFLSPYKIFSIQYLLQIGAGAMLYFAVTYQFRQSKHLSMLADVLLGLAMVVAIGGLAGYQFFDQARASGFFGNYQPLASLTMLLLPIVAALAIGDKKTKRQIVAQITLVLMVGCLLLTQVRSAWMGSITGLLMLALLASRVSERVEEKSLRRQSKAAGAGLSWKTRKDQFVLPALLAVLAMGFVVTMNAQNGAVVQRASTLSQLGTDHSWQARVGDSWQGALQMIEQRPLTGWGAGLFPFYQHQFTHQGTAIDPSGTGVRISMFEQAHNFYLQTAAELGLIGLGLMLAVLICFWTAAWRRIPTMEAGIRRTLLMAATAASVGFAFDAVSSPSWQYAQTSMFLWLVLGIGTSCLRPRLRHEANEAETAQLMTRRATWVARPAAVGLFLLFTTLLPTAYSSAQDIYPPTGSRSGNGVFKVAFGVAIVGVVGYLIGDLTGNSFFIFGKRKRDGDEENQMTVQQAPGV